MKIAEVHQLNFDNPGLIEISEELDKLPRHRIDTINWLQFAYKPDVEFVIACTANEILIKYYVSEKYFRAEIIRPNGNVYEDSCVEFFVSPVNDDVYYNFEFNAKGICLMGSGTGRHDRTRSHPDLVSQVRTLPSFENMPQRDEHGNYLWNLTVAIPFTLISDHKIQDLSKSMLRANFYKCGDKLRIPHYLSWNPVNTVKPDFHRPEFFGLLNFR